ncbi:tonB-system energizer ExbB [Bosea sp. (in: a-proteobacteria)]|uniref:tonB-system energizer ExbB n=1 Tax=Bosea sp. (in: a-proteobacteria) TaxID=1871050 RepID=UPI002FC744D5
MQRLIGLVLLAMSLAVLPGTGSTGLAQTAPSQTVPPDAAPTLPADAQVQPVPAAPGAPVPAMPAGVPHGAIGPSVPSTMTPLSPAPAPPASPVAQATLPHDLSPWGMFMAADIVVKAVMVGLAFASLVTWTIWLAKAAELAAAKARAQGATRRLEQAANLDEAAQAVAGRRGRAQGAVAILVAAAQGERERSGDLGEEGVKERVAIALSRIEARAGRAMSRGTGLLATIGSTAPFVGLFGTVWGIMNSFIGISQSKTTNLAVVAPGIAEALLATALGLVAAIPAVIIYNVFARAIAGYRATLSDASGEVLRHLSRDLERARRATARASLHAVPAQASAAMPPRARAE